eukprot:TRINITY_DN563_c0_g1_i2.p1 TRINITY_DN563_c0_g1~~TRINITY_DN563_c0_g1_i2.p1  ORF type:complete len:253 (-),score=138.90 TRINITY_DN563_c0_g1_i2:19-738(-)
MSWDDSDSEGGGLATIDTPSTAGAWDDEDVEDTNVEAWDADVAAPAPKAAHVPGERKKKTQAQLRQEKSEKLARERAEAANADDPETAKAKAQRRAERADLAIAADLFGTDVRDIEADALFADSDDEDAAEMAANAAAQLRELNTTDKLLSQQPKTEFEFTKYAGMVTEHVTRHKSNYLYMHLVKQMVKAMTSDFKAEELKELHAFVGVQMNDRLRIEREADGKKKKSKGKANIPRTLR